MISQLVVHIGDPKAGSTALQNVLSRGGWQSDVSLIYLSDFNNSNLVRAIKDPLAKKQENILFGQIAVKMSKSDAMAGVLSAEGFSTVQPERLMAALTRHMPSLVGNMRIILYLRPHLERLTASFAENIKRGVGGSDVEQFHVQTLKSGDFLYFPRVAAWRAVFGERLIVRPMVRSELVQGDIVADFLSLALDGAPFEVTERGGSNASLSLEDLAMLRFAHGIIQARATTSTDRAHQALGWRIATILSDLPSTQSTKFALPRTLAEDAAVAYTEDAKMLDNQLFKREIMLPALLHGIEAAPLKPQSLYAVDHFTPETLRLIKAWAAVIVPVLQDDPLAAKRMFWSDLIAPRYLTSSTQTVFRERARRLIGRLMR
ncbi:hypothetical protein C1J03_05345 [Sulfitobacter sp. SK012]|uniref:hypothetical protein n=1 Tax=Sulfitobacter sp. SK012 TaxID=1389005 RepID=UPI000E0CAF72|nr:hypothetical protein [Sulfitobacter sp. SK012]AXI45512.1 hypothetical protein C1J03_05345 [Sulfitobacter sp. SK012]